VLYTGTPDAAIIEMNGKIYSKAIPKNEVEYYRARYRLISTQLKVGTQHIRIFSEFDPEAGFVSSVPNLEDVYFHYAGTKAEVNTF
jgi:hypothetical protein